MEASLLAFKYKSLRLACQYKGKSIISLGWSCRKYIKWDAVHVGDDRPILKEFGDAAVDQQIIMLSHLPRVNEVLLNVQRWRLDKDNFSVEPELEPAWKHVSELIVSANSNPLVVISFLKERLRDFGEIAPSEFRKYFLTILLLNLIADVLKVNLPSFTESSQIPTILEFIESHPSILGEVYELDILKRANTPEESALYLGLPLLDEDYEFESLDHSDLGQNINLSVVYSEMPLTRFYEYSCSQEARVLYLNSNHSFVKKITMDSALLVEFTKYLEAYAKTVEESSSSNKLEDFNSYFSLNLNRAFRY